MSCQGLCVGSCLPVNSLPLLPESRGPQGVPWNFGSNQKHDWKLLYDAQDSKGHHF